MQIIRTICGMCGGDNCGIDVHIDGSQIVAVRGTKQHPLNQGRLCPQATAVVELTNHPARLAFPMQRTHHGWQRITWDEALDTVADRLSELSSTYGPQALSIYIGRALLQFLRDGWPQRFLSLYGSPNLARNDHMCSYPTTVVEEVTYGGATVYGAEADHVRCMVLWGANPATSHMPFIWHDIQQARKQGCRLIVVDPRSTVPAQRADIHAAPRPGTDLALALGLIHVIIQEGLYDRNFVTTWTVGFDRLAEQVSGLNPHVVADITGVPAETIIQIARLYATTKPAYLTAGNALEHQSNSTQTLRAVCILRAITGNLDVPGGNVLLDAPPSTSMALPERKPTQPPLGSQRYPVFTNHAGFVPGDALLAAILEDQPYPIRAMIMAGGNPALTWPESRRVGEALSALDFLAVMDLRMTATAKQAHLVLPAASPLEKLQLIVRPGPYSGRPTWHIALRRPVVDPGERRSDWWFWAQLARRLGFGEFYPWADERAAIDAQLTPLGLSVAELDRNPGGVLWGEPMQYCKYERSGFATPSGKVEIYSAELAAAGHDPVPVYVEPCESPISTPETAATYPLVLTTGRRSPAYTISRHRELESLRRLDPEPLAEINPETAQKYAIADRDPIRVETRRGAIELRARVTNDIRPDVVSLLPGWSKANANLLTDSRTCDPVLSCPPLRSGLCRVQRIDKVAAIEETTA